MSTLRSPPVAERRCWLLVCCLWVGASACASIPKGRYGVDSLEVVGAEQMDKRALLACLATRQRSWFSVDLGFGSEPECGVPPFDRHRMHAELFRWPWTEWPLLDRAVLERDMERVERWYRARGFYGARVRATAVEPPQALERGSQTEKSCPDGCEADVTIVVEEGQPIVVHSLTINGIEELPNDVLTALLDPLALEVGGRFDEALYDQTREAIQRTLANASYAHATVRGRVEIDRRTQSAKITLTVDPGPPCVFGKVIVQGEAPATSQGGLCDARDMVEENASAIQAAALITPGDRFSRDAVGDAQHAIFGLGAFSSVEVEAQIPEDRSERVIPLVVRVAPGRLCRFGVGAGWLVGTRDPLNASADSVPEWDFHLLAFGESRNLLGGLRRLRIEERPRLIFRDEFPQGLDRRRFGNSIRLDFRQPSFIEPRTTLALRALWDLGPDPFNGFFRHDIDARVGPERYFFDSRLLLALRLRENVLLPLDTGNNVPSDHDVMFLEQFATLDLRDNPRQPTRGAFFSMALHEAGYFLPASWDYIRLTPEVRGYVPLPFGLVLAGRFAIGALFVTSPNCPRREDGSDPEQCGSLDPTSARLGPQRYRLRGGGATSNRGFLPGDLGDSEAGGIRRWDASLELRIPVTTSFGVVTFADVGDVHDEDTFRFEYLHLSLGLGLRYRTVVGPLRLDVGWQVPEMQVLGDEDRLVGEEARTQANLGFVRFDGAVHLTIGEAF